MPLISYPRFSASEYSERLNEMKSLGISSLFLGSGPSIIHGLRIAGKGWVGLVIMGKMGDRTCAVKIRRIDADRKNMDEEARLQRLANDAGAGPLVFVHTKNLIVMEFIQGRSIVEWVSDGPRASAVRDVTRSILEQCHRLDMAGIDHGQLSRLDRHVIVPEQKHAIPCLVDFESASTLRRVSNVTSATQSLFLHGAVARRVKKILGDAETDVVISALRRYKERPGATGFRGLLDSLPI